MVLAQSLRKVCVDVDSKKPACSAHVEPTDSAWPSHSKTATTHWAILLPANFDTGTHTAVPVRIVVIPVDVGVHVLKWLAVRRALSKTIGTRGMIGPMVAVRRKASAMV